MKTTTYSLKNSTIILLALICFFIGTNTTHAYVTTNQEVEILPDHAALFRIDYEFGHRNHEILIPALAQNSETHATNSISYSIVDKNGSTTAGKISGFVFSNAKIESDALYHIPKGNKKKFSLIVLFRPETHDLGKEYRLQVTNLPFNFDGKQELSLTPSELQYYTTQTTSL